jgi:hypothetical protein
MIFLAVGCFIIFDFILDYKNNFFRRLLYQLPGWNVPIRYGTLPPEVGKVLKAGIKDSALNYLKAPARPVYSHTIENMW